MLKHSLFFAILPDRERAEAAYALGGELCCHKGLKGARRPLETLHISLLSIAKDQPNPPSGQVISRAEAAGSRMAMRPFRVSFNRVESWTRNRARGPIVLVGEEGVIGVDELHRRITHAHGRAPDPGFNAHMSLIWGPDAFAPVYVEPLSWTVREFALVHSFVGLSRYEVLARFALRDEGGAGLSATAA